MWADHLTKKSFNRHVHLNRLLIFNSSISICKKIRQLLIQPIQRIKVYGTNRHD